MRLIRKYFRLFYRRNTSKTIEGLVLTNNSNVVSKSGATFATSDSADEIFVGITLDVGGYTFRVVSIDSDTEFTIDDSFGGSTGSYVGYFSTPKIGDILPEMLINEVDNYWTEFKDVAVGAKYAIKKGMSVPVYGNDPVTIEEIGEIELNVLGDGDYTNFSQNNWNKLRKDIHQKDVDILIFNKKKDYPYARGYYNIFGNAEIDNVSGMLPKIKLTGNPYRPFFDEDDVMLYFENPFIAIWNTGSGIEGASPPFHLVIPFANNVDYLQIDWGDGTIESYYNTDEISHIYPDINTYETKIISSLFTLKPYSTKDTTKLIGINNWGESYIGEGTFANAVLLEYLPTFAKITTNSINSLLNLAGMFNSNVCNWDVHNVSSFSRTFRGNTNFNQNLGMWDISNAIYMSQMLDYCGMSVENYNATLIGWESQNVKNNVELGARGLHATGEGALARQRLVDDHNWHIIDGDGDHHQ